MNPGFPLPPKLIELLETGRWVHPGDEVMLAKVPFIHDPLVFRGSHELLSDLPPLMGEHEFENDSLFEYRGSMVNDRDLPWIDVEKRRIMIYNKYPGDDVSIALDYRTGIKSPRVVGSDWHSGSGCMYRQISESFDEFALLIGLATE